MGGSGGRSFWDGVPTLLDWKRRVFELYAMVRHADDPAAAWERWRATRAQLFRSHPQSPIPAASRDAFAGVPYFDHDPAWRTFGVMDEAEPLHMEVAASGDEPGVSFGFTRFATVRFELGGRALSLDAFWLESYGGGMFLPFRDLTSGKDTYGAGRYLLDTVKGSDLGVDGEGRLVLDFNFAYNPSCAYDPKWVCPLAPPGNRLDLEVRAGERYPWRPAQEMARSEPTGPT
jgi:uncharacterized protein (DUF1684 family)